MKNNIWKLVLPLAAASSLLLTACGHSAAGGAYYAETTAAYAAYDDYDYDYELAAEEAAPMAAMAVAGSGFNSSNGMSMISEGAGYKEAETAAETIDPATPVERKLIRNVNLSMQTTEYDAVTANVRARVTEYGGYIESSNANDVGYNGRANRSMNLTIRIPAARLDAFLESAVAGAKVTNRSENTEDITLRYTDLEARVSTLEVERERLMELLAEAENIDSIIALEERLSEIRYELESIKSSLRVYDNQVSYSTVWMDIREVQVLQETREATFGERVEAGFKANFLELMDSVTDLLIWIITNLPGIILFFVVLWAALKIAGMIFGKEFREARKEHRRQKKEAKKARRAARKAEKQFETLNTETISETGTESTAPKQQ